MCISTITKLYRTANSQLSLLFIFNNMSLFPFGFHSLLFKTLAVKVKANSAWEMVEGPGNLGNPSTNP